jgi:hypothetical protein
VVPDLDLDLGVPVIMAAAAIRRMDMLNPPD